MLSPKRKSPAKYKLATRHKLPRALKKAIKKKLVKIVKEAKKEIAEEQVLESPLTIVIKHKLTHSSITAPQNHHRHGFTHIRTHQLYQKP
jgi:hypothetical protein